MHEIVGLVVSLLPDSRVVLPKGFELLEEDSGTTRRGSLLNARISTWVRAIEVGPPSAHLWESKTGRETLALAPLGS